MSKLKQATEAYFSDTPKWAKMVRLTGIAVGALGGTLLTGGAALPAALVSAAPYMVMLGNFTALFVQGFKK
jgi:hypothetical protein